MDQGRTAGDAAPPSQVSSCQAVEQALRLHPAAGRGGYLDFGSAREQSLPPVRLPCMVIASKAATIPSLLFGSSAV